MYNVDKIKQEAIFINYLLIYEWIMECYPLLFPRIDVDARPGDKSLKKQSRDPRAWIKVFDRIVGKDIINQNRYAKLPLHSVFRHLTTLKKESLKK